MIALRATAALAVASSAAVTALACSLLAHADAHAQASAAEPSTDAPPAARLPAARLIDISIPDDFTLSAEQAALTRMSLDQEPHLGGLAYSADIEVRHREHGPTTLIITSLASKQPVAYPDAVIHSEFAQLRGTPERAGLTDDEVAVDAWETRVVERGAEARLRWRHLGYQTETRARALAYRVPSGHLHYVQAECIHPIADDADTAAVCQQILDSMAIPDKLDAERSLAADPSPSPPAPDDTDSNASLRTPPDPGGQPLPVIPVERPRQRDYRQLLWLVGGILLVVALYLTTRSRTRSESPSPSEANDTSGDNDHADDLDHAKDDS